MPRNVEVKIRVNDPERIKEKILYLKSTDPKDDGGKSVVLKQKDVFYNLPNTSSTRKLKFRRIEGSPSELIYYDREESTGPKLSTFEKCEVPEELETILTKALGTLGIVKKNRTLIIVGQTRVHFDHVEGLGDFIELEVVLRDNQTTEDGYVIAKFLMNFMEVEEKDIISVSYLNMLSKE